jgi:hypothetical protein
MFTDYDPRIHGVVFEMPNSVAEHYLHLEMKWMAKLLRARALLWCENPDEFA